MRIPLVTYNPVEAIVTVVHVGLQVAETMGHLPTYAGLDMLIALWFGQPGFRLSVKSQGSCGKTGKLTSLTELDNISPDKPHRQVVTETDRAR